MRTFENLSALVEKYAKAVGVETLVKTTDLGNLIWSSKYLQIALWKVPDCTIKSIAEAKESGEQHLDESLTNQEKESSTVIDGYLILALLEHPVKELQDFIREVEMDTGVCRKHVVWPENGTLPEEIWRRIFKVTALGLFPSPESASGANMPILDEQQKRLWNKIRKGSAASTAGKILSGELE